MTVDHHRPEAALADARAPRDEDRDVLRARADALARVPPRASASETSRETLQVIVFKLGAERYALDTAHVLRVGVLRELTPLPGAAPPLYGLTQWRGDVLTVFDLRGALGATLQGITDLGRIIMLKGTDRSFGILVEGLLDIVEIDANRLKPLPREGARERSLLRGVTEDAVFVIDDHALIANYGTSATAVRHNEEKTE